MEFSNLLPELDRSVNQLTDKNRSTWFLNPVILSVVRYFLDARQNLESVSLENRNATFYNSKNQLIQWISEQIKTNSIQFATDLPLGLNPQDYYIENRKINKIIIHHTGHTLSEVGFGENFSPEYILHLSSLQLLNLFVRYHSGVNFVEYGKPIFSGRTLGNLFDLTTQNNLGFTDNYPNFICYHYLIFPDGMVFNSNSHNQNLWHSSGANLDSLGICIVGNHNQKSPTEEALLAAQKLIYKLKKCYEIDNQNILGHRESHPKHQNNSCPGDTFFGKSGWKYLLTQNL